MTLERQAKLRGVAPPPEPPSAEEVALVAAELAASLVAGELPNFKEQPINTITSADVAAALGKCDDVGQRRLRKWIAEGKVELVGKVGGLRVYRKVV